MREIERMRVGKRTPQLGGVCFLRPERGGLQARGQGNGRTRRGKGRLP